jgi:hypothetical protein
MNAAVSEDPRKARGISALAWLALGVGVLTCAWVFWSISSASSSFYLALFGPADDGAFLVLLPIYVLAALLDIALFFAMKGWRSRVIAISGIVALLLPIPVEIWIPGLIS